MSIDTKGRYLVEYLTARGFSVENGLGFSIPTGERPQRLTHPMLQRSTLFVANNYISGLGKFRDLALEASPTLYGRFNEPIWQGAQLAELIGVIGARYAPPQ
jgi:hypothetical protein